MRQRIALLALLAVENPRPVSRDKLVADGARVVVDEGGSKKCDDPVLQFPVLVDGHAPARIDA